MLTSLSSFELSFLTLADGEFWQIPSSGLFSYNASENTSRPLWFLVIVTRSEECIALSNKISNPCSTYLNTIDPFSPFRKF
jgi:hypothetical protein